MLNLQFLDVKEKCNISLSDLISINPNGRGGKPCVGRTGLRVTDLVIAHLFHERTPDELTVDYGISLAEVYASLAFYYLNKKTLDEEIRQQIQTARQAREDHPDLG